VIVARPLLLLLIDPGLGFLGRGKLLARDEVVLIPDIGVEMEGRMRWIGE
jgi:hypothetical protein